MPARRYQTPSRVRQTSSASILPPLVKRIAGLPPSFLPIPGPLVETGATVVRECDVAVRSAPSLGDGAGDAAASDDEAVATGGGATTGAATGAMLITATGGISATSSPRELKLE